MKITITSSDRLKLIGLMQLASYHTSHLRDIERTAAELLGVPADSHLGGNYYGHVSDEIYGLDQNADALLQRLAITVDTEEAK